MEIDRAKFLQNIKISNSSDETNELMLAIRDGFTHLMACYNLFTPCIDVNEFEIISHDPDYNSINIKLSKNISSKFEEFLSTIPQPVTLNVYGDYFCFEKFSSDEDSMIYTLKRINLS